MTAAAAPDTHDSSRSILAKAAETGKANKFLTAVYLAELLETLRDDGPFTVFVPIDAAFDKIPTADLIALFQPENKSKLRKILTYHVVNDRIPASRVTSKPRLKTVEGRGLTIAANAKGVAVDNATIVETDIIGRNGIVHLIDRVLIPPSDDTLVPATTRNLITTAEQAGQFTTLLKALDIAGLTDTLREKGPFTVLAPTDEAFAKLGHRSIAALLNDKEKLAELLKLHVIPGKIKARDLLAGASLKTLAGERLQPSIVKGRLMVNQANVIDTDIDAGNGIVHAINRVLIPSKSSH
jgi:uncharacterized surface protein with fasciclin (FAS1) repeats